MLKDLSTILVKGLGKKVVSDLANEAAMDAKLYEELLGFVETGTPTQAMKSSWIIGTATEIDNTFASKNSSRILALALNSKVGGVQREMLKALNGIKLKEDDEGVFLNFCFQKLAEAESDLAVKYHSAAEIERALKKYPELLNEFITLLEGSLDMHTEAWKRYTMKRIGKLQKRYLNK